jgi:hypothetical protein
LDLTEQVVKTVDQYPFFNFRLFLPLDGNVASLQIDVGVLGDRAVLLASRACLVDANECPLLAALPYRRRSRVFV